MTGREGARDERDERDEDRRPTVSVVVPIHERPEAVAAVVETLHAQTLTDWEALIVDDGSTTDLGAVVRPWLDDPRIRYLRLDRNRGPSAARNAGIDAASGHLVAFLDSDDTWAPEKLERQVSLVGGASRTMCVTLTNVVMPGGWVQVRPTSRPRDGEPFGDYLYCDGGYAQASSLLVTRDLVQTVRFDEDLRQYEDHLFYVALAGAGARYVVVDDALTTRDNQDRDDRLGAQDDLDRGARYLSAAGPLLSERARLAFGLRILGPLRLRHEPVQVARDAARALRSGAIDARAIGAMVINGVAPAPVRSLAIRLAARPAATGHGTPGAEGSSSPPFAVRTGRDYPVSFLVDLGQRNARITRGPQAPLKRVARWGDAIGVMPDPRWDLIHTFNAVPVLTRTRYVISFEDHLPRCPDDRSSSRWLNPSLRRQLLSARCVRLLAMSEWALRTFRRQQAAWPDLDRVLAKTEVLYPAVGLRATRPKRAGDRLRVCFVGNDFMRKGGPALVRAHERLRRAGVPIDTTVVSSLRWRADDYIGPCSPRAYEAEVERLAGAEGIVHRGAVPNAEVLRVMDESDYLVFPTLHDTFGFVSLEALAGATPVIATGTCALPEVVDHGRSGYLLPFDNDGTGRWRHLHRQDRPGYDDRYEETIEQLAGALEDRLARCWDERAGYEALSEGAIERVRERFDREQARARLEVIYADAAGNEGGRR